MRSRRRGSRYLIAAGACVTAGVVAAAVLTARAVTQEDQAGSANGVTISTAQLSGAQTVTARVQRHDPSYQPDLAALARRQLDLREAERRGFSCTLAEAEAQLQSTIATATERDLLDGLLVTIEDSGDAPAGYHLTPEASRNPGTDDVVTAYVNDPNVIATQQRLCTVGKLMQSVEDAAQPAAGATVIGRPPNAVATFRAALYANATVTGADGDTIDVRYATATPSPQ
jgi:hypothetical protein